MVGRSWGRPTVAGGTSGIITFGTISPNDCLCGNFVAAPGAACKPSTSSRPWPCVEAKAGVRSRHTVKEIGSIVQQLKEVPDYRKRIGTYPLWSLLAIYLLAVLCEAPRGSKDLAKFARKLSQDQRRALGIRQRQGRYPAPSQPTFWRLLEEISGPHLEQALLQVQDAVARPSAQKGVDRPGRQRAQTWRRSKRAHRRLRAQPVLLGQRDGRHQDQRDPRGPKTLSRLGPQGPVRLAGCPAHPDRNGSPDRAGRRRGLSADG